MLIKLIEPLGISENKLNSFKNKLIHTNVDFISYSDKAKNNQDLYERSKDADVLMIANGKLPNQVICKLDRLKYINVAFTGIDHIGLKEVKKRGILVTNASGYSDVSVSELVIGLALDLYRKISLSNEKIKKQGLAYLGKELRGKKVGIIGTGKIGIETAKLFKAFGCEVLGYSRTVRQEFEKIANYVSLEELLKNSDIVSLHLPANKETERFLGKEELDLLKKSAILINCARGKILDNDYLAKILNEGKIAGAGIDVFDMEPPIPEDYLLLKAKNTVLTAHQAFLTEEAMLRRAEIVFDNMIAYIEGNPKNVCKL